MGFLDFETEAEHLKRVKTALKRRGLTMDQTDNWEIHGPHQDMNYQVYIGPAYKDGKWQCIAVIYPWAVYEASNHSEWGKVTAEDRIPVLKPVSGRDIRRT